MGIGIALMFLYTWPFDLSNSGVLSFQIPFAIDFTVGWGFIFVSLFMTWVTLGKDAEPEARSGRVDGLWNAGSGDVDDGNGPLLAVLVCAGG